MAAPRNPGGLLVGQSWGWTLAGFDLADSIRESVASFCRSRALTPAQHGKLIESGRVSLRTIVRGS